MSDIVERLRRMSDMTTTDNDLQDIGKAAAEIATLRARVAELEAGLAAERERCAKIAEAMADSAMRGDNGEWLGHRLIPMVIASRIRRAVT